MASEVGDDDGGAHSEKCVEVLQPTGQVQRMKRGMRVLGAGAEEMVRVPRSLDGLVAAVWVIRVWRASMRWLGGWGGGTPGGRVVLTW